MSVFADRVVELLLGSPCALTAKQVAERLGANPKNIVSLMSKLAAYGIIHRVRGRFAPNGRVCAAYMAVSSDTLGVATQKPQQSRDVRTT